jgi:hypothetical protein
VNFQELLVLLLIDSVLLVVACALFDPFVCGQQCYTYIRIIFVFNKLTGEN